MTWLQRIRAARKRGIFTMKDLRDSQNWNSCAVSENKRIKRREGNDPDMPPTSQKASLLGHDFYNAVMCNDFDSAEILLRRIKKL